MSRGRTLRALLLAGTVAGLPMAAHGQATTIVADVGATHGLGTTVAQSGATVTIDGGTVAGANLFHSFSQFSLAAGDTARWTRAGGDPAAISNVINRVTGGQASQLNGTLDSAALPNAAFFFINPAGVVFGPGAQVNVPAAAYFSTASDLRFTDGATFAVATPTGSTLSVGAPESFGFVGGQGAINVGAVGQTFTPAGASLSFTGSDIVFDGAQITATSLDLTAVGPGSATVALADPLAAASLGAVTLSNSHIIATPSGEPTGALRISGGAVTLDATMLTSSTPGAAPGADVAVAADQLQLFNGSRIDALTQGAGAGGSVTITANGIDAENGFLSTTSLGAGAGGRLSVTADTITLVDFALGSNATMGGAGGDVLVSAGSFLDMEGSGAVANTYGPARGGDVTVAARSMLLNGAVVSTNAGGTGTPGDVMLSGQDIDVEGGELGPGVGTLLGNLNVVASSSLTITRTIVNASTTAFGAGAAGVLSFSAPKITFSNALIETLSTNDAAAGAIRIQGQTVFLDDSTIQSTTYGRGAGGAISIKADNLRISNGKVTSATFGFTDDRDSGGAGDVTLDAASITIDTSAQISSDTNGDGKAGAVLISGGSVDLEDGASVTSAANGGTGDAGLVSIQSDSLTLNDAVISTNATSLGAGGDIDIHTGNLTLDGNGRPFTYISSDSLSAGDAGSVSIHANTIALRNQGYVSSETYGDGAAGRVSITAGSMTVRDGSYVASDTRGFGNAGDVSVTADNLLVQGRGGGDQLTYISSDSLGGGDAGTVTIDAKSLKIVLGGFITSDTYTGADAGDVTVRADSVTLETGGQLRTDTRDGGAAGALSIRTKTLSIDGANVSSSAEVGSFGASGALSIFADKVSVANGGLISTVSNNENPAGQIDLIAASIFVDGDGSEIASENQAGNTALGNTAGESGAAGTVHLASSNITVSNGGRISTNSFAGAAGDIEIAMPKGSLLTLAGADLPGSIQTSSGIGTGGKITISSPLAVVSNGGSILALGQQRGANVLIDSIYFVKSSDRANTVNVDGDFKLVAGVYDVSAGTVNRDLSVLDASKVLRGQCPVTRSTGQLSQLVTRQVGPYAREPAFDLTPGPRSRPSAGGEGCS
jgi:filamentous hemagglutinin family protein